MTTPSCPTCDHTHATGDVVVAGSRFVPGVKSYRPLDAGGPVFGARDLAQAYLCAARVARRGGESS